MGNSWYLSKFKQGVLDCKGTENWAKLFSYVGNGKKIEEWFASTLNRITASFRSVSSMIAVLNAKSPQLIAARANKKTMRNEEA